MDPAPTCRGTSFCSLDIPTSPTLLAYGERARVTENGAAPRTEPRDFQGRRPAPGARVGSFRGPESTGSFVRVRPASLNCLFIYNFYKRIHLLSQYFLIFYLYCVFFLYVGTGQVDTNIVFVVLNQFTLQSLSL